MASGDAGYSLATLKAATYRLTVTPADQLPSVIPSICAQLASCKAILSTEKDALSKVDGGPSTFVHKLKIWISTRLQSRSPEDRWGGTVLAKTTVDCGGHAILQDVGSKWVQCLLSCLNKHDPITSKKLVITTLTRIFYLTRDHQTLVRETTTPNLPAFVSSCIQLANSTPQLAPVVLGAFSKLITRHPSIFRSYVNQVRPILLQYVATVKPRPRITEDTARTVRRLFVQRHETVPKNAAAAEWETGLQRTITCIHETADQVFRSVLEDWESSTGYQSTQHNVQALSAEPARFEKDLLGLGDWSGLEQGSRKIDGLLGLLRLYLTTSTSFATAINIGAIVDLLRRLTSLVRPGSPREWESTGRADTRFDRKEREDLALLLPDMHATVAEVTLALVARLGPSSTAIAGELLRQLTWVFEAEKAVPSLRESIYLVACELLQYFGKGLDERTVTSLSGIAMYCCKDLLSPQGFSQPVNGQMVHSKVNGVSPDLLTSSTTPQVPQCTVTDTGLAVYLLSVLLSNLRAELIPRTVRAELDRTAVLTQHKAALIASVQNPSAHLQSLLPLLARLFPHDSDVQGLLKPRMPVILHSLEPEEDVEDEEVVDNGTFDDETTGGRLYQAVYEKLGDKFATNRGTIDHLFPADDGRRGNEKPRRDFFGNLVDEDDVSRLAPYTEAEGSAGKRTFEHGEVMEEAVAKRPRVDDALPAPVDVEAKSPIRPLDVVSVAQHPSTLTTQEFASGVPLPLQAPSSATSHAGLSSISGQQRKGPKEEEDSDDEDFIMPQLHFRSASDDEDDD